jgi:hypothetical protein
MLTRLGNRQPSFSHPPTSIATAKRPDSCLKKHLGSKNKQKTNKNQNSRFMMGSENLDLANSCNFFHDTFVKPDHSVALSTSDVR